MTIIREPASTLDAPALALQALGWVLSDDPRAERFLGLTGLTPEELRAGLGEPAILGAVLDFLANHEDDLVNAASAFNISPAAIIAARKDLA